MCIFAYGQTGSGKTFTIIGDQQQKLPGIAPRAFDRIFELIEENKYSHLFFLQYFSIVNFFLEMSVLYQGDIDQMLFNWWASIVDSGQTMPHVCWECYALLLNQK